MLLREHSHIEKMMHLVCVCACVRACVCACACVYYVFLIDSLFVYFQEAVLESQLKVRFSDNHT